MLHKRQALSALMLAATTACASASGPLAGAPIVTDAGVPIEVENATPVNLRLYAIHGGIEVPLGRVDAMGHRITRLPGTAAGMIRLVAKPAVDLGMGRSYRTEPVSVLRGQRVTWRLQSSPGVSDLPRMSNVRVFDCVDTDHC